MLPKRRIDERDLDRLLESLTDRQIAELFGMLEETVANIRRGRRGNGHGKDAVELTNGTGKQSSNGTGNSGEREKE